MKATDVLDQILANKLFYFGIAILMVVLTHIELVDNNRIWCIFYPGFLGVDIFMFFSGYGLCYSYQKNNLTIFYKRRFLRIAPVFFLMVIVVSLVSICNGRNMSVWDWFCNLTTLNYYCLGGFYIEWYLCAVVVFYLSFPLLFSLCKRCESVNGEGILLILVLIFCILLSILCGKWEYVCAIGRIPIFILGILLYINKKPLKKYLFIFCFFFLLTIPLFILGLLPRFYVFYMAAPIIIGLMGLLGEIIIQSEGIKSVLEWIGKHTLELYVTNIVICYVMKHNDYFAGGFIVYLLGFVALTPLFIFSNKFITSLLKK